MESFFASLKEELIHGADFATREQARAEIFEYIEMFYNRVRRHSALGYLSPDEYERVASPLTPRSPIVGKSSGSVTSRCCHCRIPGGSAASARACRF